MFKVNDIVEHKLTNEKFIIVEYDQTFSSYCIESLNGGKYKIWQSEKSLNMSYKKSATGTTPQFKTGDILIYNGSAALIGVKIEILAVNFDSQTYKYCYITNKSPLDYTRSWAGIHSDYCYPNNNKTKEEPECTCDGYTLFHKGCQCKDRTKFDIDARWKELLGGENE